MTVSTKEIEVTDVRKQTYSFGGKEGKGINWETGIDIYILLYKIDNNEDYTV